MFLSRFFTLSLSKGAACDPNACAFSNNDVASVRFLLLVAFSCQHYIARSVSSVLSNNRISEASTHEDQSDTPTMSLTQRNGYHERWLFIHSPIHPYFRIAPPHSICVQYGREGHGKVGFLRGSLTIATFLCTFSLKADYNETLHCKRCEKDQIGLTSFIYSSLSPIT